MLYKLIKGEKFERHQKINNKLVTVKNVDEYLK